MSWINKILKGDRVIWIVMIILGVISLLAVYSATSSEAHVAGGIYNDKVLLKHAATLLGGFVMMYFASRIDYRRYSRAIELILLLCCVLLVFTMAFGSRVNGASRSIMGFQTSELAKIVLIAYLAKYIVVWNQKDYTFKQILVPLILPIILIVGPIFPENFSTAAMLFLVCLVMMYLGQIKIKYLLMLVGFAILGAGLYILTDDIVAERQQKRYERIVQLYNENPNDEKLKERIKHKPRVSRVSTWKGRMGANENEEMATDGTGTATATVKPLKVTEGHDAQKTFAKIAVAQGGLFGKGSGKSTQRNFLPQPFSDCIYAIIIEEYGLVGGAFVMLLYIILFTRTIRIMKRRPLSFGALMSFGIAFILIVQAMINMGVSTGLFPITGQQLPFVSRGGSSMLMTGFAVGMILSVTKSIDDEKPSTGDESENELETNDTETTETIETETIENEQ